MPTAQRRLTCPEPGRVCGWRLSCSERKPPRPELRGLLECSRWGRCFAWEEGKKKESDDNKDKESLLETSSHIPAMVYAALGEVFVELACRNVASNLRGATSSLTPILCWRVELGGEAYVILLPPPPDHGLWRTGVKNRCKEQEAD